MLSRFKRESFSGLVIVGVELWLSGGVSLGRGITIIVGLTFRQHCCQCSPGCLWWMWVIWMAGLFFFLIFFCLLPTRLVGASIFIGGEAQSVGERQLSLAAVDGSPHPFTGIQPQVSIVYGHPCVDDCIRVEDLWLEVFIDMEEEGRCVVE